MDAALIKSLKMQGEFDLYFAKFENEFAELVIQGSKALGGKDAFKATLYNAYIHGAHASDTI